MHFSFYTITWYFIHLIFTLSLCVYQFCVRVRIKIQDLQIKFCDPLDVFKEVQNKASQLKKIPPHITVILGWDPPSYADLAKLLIWSVASGVSFISFYDIEGRLKKTEYEIRKEVEKIIPQNHHIIWHDSPKNGYKNGITGKKIHAKVYDPSDGRETIASVCKELSKCKEVNIEVVNQCLREHYEFPDPHLGIYFGKHLNMSGYPPWQIRLTEFLTIPTHHNINHNSFIKLLQRFEQCEERIGK